MNWDAQHFEPVRKYFRVLRTFLIHTFMGKSLYLPHSLKALKYSNNLFLPSRVFALSIRGFCINLYIYIVWLVESIYDLYWIYYLLCFLLFGKDVDCSFVLNPKIYNVITSHALQNGTEPSVPFIHNETVFAASEWFLFPSPTPKGKKRF